MNKLRKHGVYYDSRIKLLLILLTSALAFALGGGLTGLLLFGVVCLFALLSGLWKTSIKVAIVYIVLLMLAQVLYCPKCKRKSLIQAKQLHIVVIKEPDA